MQDGITEIADIFVGMHIENWLETGTVGICPGVSMAASHPLHIELFVKSAHASLPQTGVDALATAVETYNGIMQMKASQMNPFEQYIRSDGGKRGLETEFKNYKGLIPLLEFEDGQIKKITIKPVELGFYHEDRSVKGSPHNANDEVTQEVLETLQTLRAEYGTKLVRNNDLIEVVL